MSRNERYESEQTGSREEIAAVLSGVVDGILAGTIRLDNGADTVTVNPSDEISLEIEFESQEDELSLELELEWPSPDEETAGTPTETTSDEGSGEPPLVSAADGSQSLARFEIFRDKGEEWRWRLRHRNGNIIATSGEGYTHKHNAWNGLRSVMKNSPEAEVRDDSPN